MTTKDTKSLNWKLVISAILWRWRALLIIVVITSAMVIITSRFYQPPQLASAKILVQNSTSVNPFLSEMGVDWEVNSRLSVVQSLLNSRGFAEHMLLELEVIDNQTSPAEVDLAVQTFQTQLTVVGLDGGIIEIQFSGDTRQKALEGLHLVMDVFLDEMLRPQREALDASVAFLTEQVERMRTELETEEDAIRSFRETYPEQAPEVHQLNLELYLTQSNELRSAQAELVDAEERLRVSQQHLNSYNPRLWELEEDLDHARSEQQDLARTYQDGHPRLAAVRDRVASLERQIELMTSNDTTLDLVEIERLARRGDLSVSIDAVEGELDEHRAMLAEIGGLNRTVSSLEGQLVELRQRVVSFTGNASNLNEMLRDVDAKSVVYSRLLERLQDAIVTRELTLQEESRQVWIIEPPMTPPGKNHIPLKMASLAGVAAGLLLGLLFLFISEALDKTVRLPNEAAEAAGIPVIAVFPHLDDVD